jgi:hypothetical protein
LRKGQLAKNGGVSLANYHTYNTQYTSLNPTRQPIFKSLKDARLERKLSKQRGDGSTEGGSNHLVSHATFIDFKTVRDKVKMQK